jgi:hypothetical protein
VNSLFKSPGLTVHRSLRVAAMSVFCIKVAEPAVGFVEEGQLGLPQASLCGGGCRWRVKTQDLGSLGCDLDRWAFADGFIPSFETGVFFDSSQSRWAIGLLQISVVLIVLGGGGCRHWGCRAASATTRPRGMIVFFIFLGSFVQFDQCSSLYILFVCFYICTYFCTFLI